MATFVKFDCFLEDLAEKVHNLGSDSLVMALTNTAPTASTDDELSDISQISYTNLSSRAISITSSAQTSGTYKLTLTDLTLTASGAVSTWQYGVIYNDTASNDELIGYIDAGEAITMANGHTFTFNFDDSNGLFTIALAA